MEWRRVVGSPGHVRCGDERYHYASIMAPAGNGRWVAIVREWTYGQAPGNRGWRRYGPQAFGTIFEARRWCEGLLASFTPVQEPLAP